VDASGNLIQGGPVAVQDAGKVLPWKGKDNLYAGPSVLVAQDANGKLQVVDLGSWAERWGAQEQGSQKVERVYFQLDLFQGRPVDEALPVVRATATQTLGQLGPQAAAPGPDWDLLGPGDAYVRVLNRERGRPVTLRPEGLPTGPFVLIRGGKEHAGFLRLQLAFDAARTGDILEVRTDGPFHGGVIHGGDNALDLTVRAAPGYRPALSSDIHHEPKKGTLRLEGLIFDEHHVTGDFANLTIRNCSFRTTSTVWNVAGAIHGAGGPAQCRNYIANRSIGMKLGRGRTLAVDNCLLGAVSFEALQPGEPCQVRVEHSALWIGGPVAGLFYAPGLEARPSVRAAHSLFVSGDLLTIVAPGRLAWAGQSNVYSIGGAYFADDQVFDLEGWQKRYGSDAASQELPPVLLSTDGWRLLPDQPRRPDGGV